MIDQTLIEAANLEFFTNQHAQCFIHNTGIYKWPAMSNEERVVFVSDGDLDGKPLRDGMLMVYGTKQDKWASFLVPQMMLLKASEAKQYCEFAFEDIFNRIRTEPNTAQ
jgi:hypothetical protein